MSNPHIIIPSDLSALINERERIWQAANYSAQNVAELNQLASLIADCPPAVLQSTFTQERTPSAEIASVLPALKNELETINRLRADIAGRQVEIEQIKKRDRTIIIVAAAVVVLLLIILIVSLKS